MLHLVLLASTKTGKMILLNSEPTHGEDPCYVELGNGFALTANYSGGTMSYFPLLLNGEVGPNYALLKALKTLPTLGVSICPTFIAQRLPTMAIYLPPTSVVIKFLLIRSTRQRKDRSTRYCCKNRRTLGTSPSYFLEEWRTCLPY